MKISSDYFIFIDIGIILIFLFNVIVAYKKGLVYEVLHLAFKIVNVIVSYKLCSYFANAYPIITIENEIINELVNLQELCNDVLWFVIIFAIISLLVSILLPLFKFVSKIPIIGVINKIGGVLFGLLCATITVLCLSFVLTLPVIENGEEVKQNTLIRYVSFYSDEAINIISENINIEK